MRKPKTISLVGSRSSGVGQNIREWWVGEKNCVIDGNAIGLRWLSIVVERAKKNNERMQREEIRIPNFLPRQENVWLRQAHRNENFFAFRGKLITFISM
jgi:hypothetical protein